MTVAEVTSKLVGIAREFFPNDQLVLSVTTNVASLNWSINVTRGLDLADKVSTAPPLDSDYLICTAAALRAANGSRGVGYQCGDGIAATVTFDNFNAVEGVRLLAVLSQHFTFVHYTSLLRSQATDTERAAMEYREQALAELQQAIASLGEQQASLTMREAESRQRLQEDLEKSYRSRQDALDEDHRRRTEELDQLHTKREDELAARVHAHQAQVEKFVTQDSKYVRRDLLARMNELLGKNESTSLSDGTNQKRSIIHRVCVTLMACSAILVGTFLTILVSRTGEAPWQLYALLSGSTIALFTTFVYYLKWNDRWFREHAEAEFAAKRYKADILRASWVAELVVEWRKENPEHDLSPQLIEAFVRNLFRSVDASQVSEHPLDELTSLVKRATSFSLGKNGLTVQGGELAQRLPGAQ